MSGIIVWFLLVILVLALCDNIQEHSPFYQHLPNCTSPETQKSFIFKKTEAKGIVCPMFKDEEGFLAEWISYYQIHGFDHVLLFDDGSIDNSLIEVQPWIDSGFVSVVANFTAESLNVSHAFLRNEFKKAMAIKAVLETQCKLFAISRGYDYHISLDLDEYVIPEREGETIMDALVRWTNETGRGVYCMEKFNFQSTPHILEPVHLLQIEAYQSRMKPPSKMNYYTSVAPKCAYKLRSKEYTNESALFVAYCCHFHGCQGHDFIRGSTFCKSHYGNEAWRVNGKGKKWQSGLYINHYSRSVEKYALKAKTWKTATGEVRAGESQEAAIKSYDIAKFLSRSVGWYHDPVALRYSCQVRYNLVNITSQPFFLRAGNFWYRNPEFGKEIADPDKRGRYGRFVPGFTHIDGNPYHYKGKYVSDNEK